ncbi:hypothetical protein GGU10DRAFT_194543 [Lentinula aff. detonsa]|uniref:Uncharacterized protein n=1 Tax=Lentinula aff. detonsa TaxID=2804958 RepID=A0AA38L4J5_9AGAR|nr:hypothetical protein GGU10DRAFT_194543 [Lentinula aff. detonsa]
MANAHTCFEHWPFLFIMPCIHDFPSVVYIRLRVCQLSFIFKILILTDICVAFLYTFYR